MLALLNPPSIVLAGSWNPAILQPQWLSHRIFGIPEGNQIAVRMEFSPIPGLPPRYSLGELTIAATYDNLTITPDNRENADAVSERKLNLVEEKAQLILRELPHTPISAFGQNFEFVEDNPSKELLAVFELNDAFAERANFTYSVQSITVKTSLQIDDHILNYSRTFSNGQVVLQFNFHYEVNSAIHAADHMQGAFARNYQLMSQLLINYGVSLEHFQEAHHD